MGRNHIVAGDWSYHETGLDQASQNKEFRIFSEGETGLLRLEVGRYA